MKKYPIMVNGQKVSREDFLDGWKNSGLADDAARSPLLKIPVETTNRRGWVIPWRSGPVVVPTGSGNGRVKVQPFTVVVSAVGAALNGGTENAADDSEGAIAGLHDNFSAEYKGGYSPIPAALSGAGKMRWDLLYAIVSQADSDAGARMVASSSGSRTVQTINTRRKSNVTLAWAQGAEKAEGAAQYDVALPALPTPASGMAHVPLALVKVHYAASMATKQYTRDHIGNCAPLARLNPQSGVAPSIVAGVAGKKSIAGSVGHDPYDLISVPSANGGWSTSDVANNRPVRAIDPASGGLEVWAAIGPFAEGFGTPTFTAGGGWSALAEPIARAQVASTELRDAKQFDWRDRVIRVELEWASGSAGAFAFDRGASGASAGFPSGRLSLTTRMGQSHREYGPDTLVAGYRTVAVFANVTGVTGDDLAIAVSSTTGALHLLGRAAASGSSLDLGIGFAVIKASPIIPL